MVYAAAIGLPIALISSYRLRGRFERHVRENDGLVCLDCGHPFPFRGAQVACPECGITQDTEAVRGTWAKHFGRFGWKPTSLDPPPVQPADAPPTVDQPSN